MTNSESARSKLEAMPLKGRIAAVAADVHSKRDEYRSILPTQLVDLLGVPYSKDRFGAYMPSEHWVKVYYCFNRTFENTEFTPDVLLSLLESEVTPNRYSELQKKFASCKEDTLSPEAVKFLAEPERAAFLSRYMEDYAERNGHDYVLANYTLDAPQGFKLRFQSNIGDAGELEDLKTPYDDRDGLFVNLSDCMITFTD